MRRPDRPEAPWEWVRRQHPRTAAVLDALRADPQRDVDLARLAHALLAAVGDDAAVAEIARQIEVHGADFGLPASGQRSLPGARFARHNLLAGQVRLGRVVPDSRNDDAVTGDFGLDQDVLRTSLLVVGPPGSGKTRGVATPIVEHLSLSALAARSSVVVVDPKGVDFAYDGWFDITIDPLDPTCGFDMFGGSPAADIAADRLASALLPPNVSDDKAYFVDASRNALYACLAPFREAFGRFPTVPELHALLRADQAAMDKVKSALKGSQGRSLRALLDTRRAQARARVDPAAGLVERFGLLDRPAWRRLFDLPRPRFAMRDINRPLRVRVALPEAEYPDGSMILARLVVSQFVQVVSSADSNRSIYKGLVIDEAGRYVDDYVARGVQRVRSHNAGLVLLTQSLSDFRADVRETVFGSTGCKAVFAGVNPDDARTFSAWFGDHYRFDVTRGRSQHAGWYDDGIRTGETHGETRSVSIRQVERPRWSASDIITGIPAGHALISLARSSGRRAGPFLVNLRAQAPA